MAGIADVDGDQRVTREEFVTGAVKRLRDNPDRFAEIARPFLRWALAVAGAEASGAGSMWIPRCGCSACSGWRRMWRGRRRPR